MKVSSKVEQSYLAVGSTFSTAPVIMENHLNCACQINLQNASGFVATSTIEVSNDLQNWIEMPNSEEDLVDNVFYDIQSATAYIRVKVTVSSGTSDINIDWVLL